MLRSYRGVNFQEVYKVMLNDLLTDGMVSAPRKMETKEFIPAVFQIDNPLSRIIALESRKMNLFYAMIETIWYMNGDNSVAPLVNYNSAMSNFSDDGMTLRGAYGSRLIKKSDALDKSQFGLVYDKLRNDPSSRQAVAIIWDPWYDHQPTKDVPCTIGFMFTIRDEKLNMTTIMRSNDIVLGTTYDVFAFTMFQEFLARKLGVELGSYTHFANSFHIYDTHYEIANTMIDDNSKVLLMPKMPETGWTLFNDLYKFEHKVRNTDEELEKFVNDAKEFGDYWRDWALMFVLHKAIKMRNAKVGHEIWFALHDSYRDMTFRWIMKLI